MLCPLCRDTTLEPRFSSGIEVDVCPRCRGLWLDRGELDRLMAAADVAPPPPAPLPHAPLPPSQRPQSRKPKSRSKRLADLLDDVLDL
jgi:Zn-finger nucleic acid-binding protein